jgi:hypothetical protein
LLIGSPGETVLALAHAYVYIHHPTAYFPEFSWLLAERLEKDQDPIVGRRDVAYSEVIVGRRLVSWFAVSS